MPKPILCTLGFHRWGRATYIDWGVGSNALDWKQKCSRCRKMIKWVQPKGVDMRFYPAYLAKRVNWWFWMGLVIFVIIMVTIMVILISFL